MDEKSLTITEDLRGEISRRLEIIADVGLDYLELHRQTSTLSGGEMQRILIASQLAGDLVGVTYVLDEPTIGLHGRDTERLLNILKRLTRLGNTVIVVEHDETVIRNADHLIDLGPGAGAMGGRVVATGTPEEVADCDASLTGKYLSKKRLVSVRGKHHHLGAPIRIAGARANNLKNISLEIPSGGLVAITGVSGSGKSSLIFDVLLPSATRKSPVYCDNLSGLQMFEAVLAMDQSPIGSSPLSTPATYVGLMDRLRTLFAGTDTATAKGYTKSQFAFNAKAGRCNTCKGMGQIKTEMVFLADVWVTCDDCQGARYNRQTLEIKLNGKNIAQVLDMTVSKAREFFYKDAKLSSQLGTLEEIGLGYLTLGQSSNTLSGGEAARLKLALELVRKVNRKKRPKPNLYIFDEPTTGLHFDDIARLLSIFERLIEKGHSMIVIEHNTDIIAAADWIVDLGPEGGDAGGKLIFSGPPASIVNCESSYTGGELAANTLMDGRSTPSR